MKLHRALLASALTLFALVPTSPALASHACAIDDPTLNSACESHPESTLLNKIFCLISPTC